MELSYMLTIFSNPKTIFHCNFSTFEMYKILIVSLFKQRKNKRFSYSPKHLKDEDIQIKQQLRSKRQTTKHLSKERSKTSSSLLIWLLILGMIIVLWLVLDNYKI
jgi:predicted nucleic acid-binding Zn ribbon protein